MKKFILLLVAIILASCSSVKKFQTKKDITYLNADSAGTLIGVYDNNWEVYRNNKIHYLWPIIDYENTKYNKIKGLKVRLVINNENQLVAELLNNSVILETKVLKGSYNHNFYQLEHQHKFAFLLIFSVWSNQSAKLALTPENDLLIVYKNAYMAIFTILPVFGSHIPVTETIYKGQSTLFR